MREGAFAADLKTKPSLLEALRKASTQNLSAEEIRQQSISFIMGTVKDTSTITHARIRNVLEKQEGRKAG